jgi:hypothetical protein
LEEFDNEVDRDYYLQEDPGHKEFVKGLQGLVQKLQIVDFTPGAF